MAKVVNVCECGHAPMYHVFRDGEYRHCDMKNCQCLKYRRKSGAVNVEELRRQRGFRGAWGR